MQTKILIIATSNGRTRDAGKPTGLWLEELAGPYWQFIDSGHAVSIASPLGGAIPIDPGSVRSAGTNAATVERFLNDAHGQALLQNSIALNTRKGSDFHAVYFPGGHGTMWDLPADANVVRVVNEAWAAERVVGSVCHGAAGLVGATKADGTPLVAGLRVNSFTDEEEIAAGLMTVVPFALEAKLRALGARFERGPMWRAFAIADGRLITGQNPASSQRVAALMIAAI